MQCQFSEISTKHRVRKQKYSKKNHLLKIFDRVMQKYFEFRFRSYVFVYQNWDGVVRDKVMRNAPLLVDFIADVDLSIKSAVSDPNTRQAFYADCFNSETSFNGETVLPKGKRQDLAQACASEFLRRGIYPVSDYFAPSWVKKDEGG